MAIKILISGYENTGKTTLISKINDALIINCDAKEFSIPVMHTNFNQWDGLKSFTDFCNDKIVAFKKAKGELPKFVVIDTISQLYMQLTRWNSNHFRGFDIHTQNNTDTLGLNTYFEKLIEKGISVIVVSHTMVDDKTSKHIIPAQGQFQKVGSFLSIVNEAIFIERSPDVHRIWLKTDKFPVRSLIEHNEENVNFNDFDINTYLEKVVNAKNESDKFRL